jgi:hypothetical protein
MVQASYNSEAGQAQLLDIDTNEYIAELKQGNSNILVCVRVRPLSKKELISQTVKSVRIID